MTANGSVLAKAANLRFLSSERELSKELKYRKSTGYVQKFNTEYSAGTVAQWRAKADEIHVSFAIIYENVNRI